MKNKKKYSMFLFILTVILLSACFDKKDGNVPTSKAKTTDDLVFASTKDIRDINPHLYAGEMPAQNIVFESLVINTDEGIKPALAESWEISKDGLTYTFYLREGVVFTDGEAFNAEAVKMNVDAVVENSKKKCVAESCG